MYFGTRRQRDPFFKRGSNSWEVDIHSGEEEKVEGYIVVMSRAYQAPHAKVYGAHAPTRGILVSLQGIPQDLNMEVKAQSMNNMIVKHCRWKEKVGRKASIT